MILFLAECYANKGLAQLLKQKLNERLKESIVLKHLRTFSRDEVIKRATSPEFLKRWCQITRLPFPSVVVALIDREEGISSIYIDERFRRKLPVKLEQYCISMYIRRKSNYITLGLVFNPHIERALEAILGQKLSQEIVDKLKSENGDSLIQRLLAKSKNLDMILRKLTDAIIQYGSL